MTSLEIIAEVQKIAEQMKKKLTSEMVRNTPAWRKFKTENKWYFDKVGDTQTAISDLTAQLARIQWNKKFK